MTFGQKLKKLRSEKGITQKELADSMHVAFQTVSKWESDTNEPDFASVRELAKFFNCSCDYLLDEENEVPQKSEEIKEEISETKIETPQPQIIVVEKEPVEQKVVLGICEQCHRPIYNADEIVTSSHSHHKGKRLVTTHGIMCTDCHNKNVRAKKAFESSKGVKRRKHAYVWPSILAAICWTICISVGVKNNLTPLIVGGIFAGIGLYCWLACMILYNNFIFDMTAEIFSWGFVKFPGVIFSLDLDGIIWLLTVKLLFWILGFLLAFAAAALALSLGMFLGVFTYPFALAKNYKSPYISC